MISKLILKYKSYKYQKYVTFGLICLIFFISYNLYVWSNSQLTDNAYIEADISNVSSEVNGVVVNVLVQDNCVVQAGDIIAELNDEDFLANFHKAGSDVIGGEESVKVGEQEILINKITQEKNQQELNLAKTNLEITEVDYKRTIELSKDNYTSKKILDNARVAYEKAKADYNIAKMDLQITEQNFLLLNMKKIADRAKLQSLMQTKLLMERSLANTKIKAPISGIIANNNLKVGNFVRQGLILFSVVPNKPYIKANYKETQVAKFKNGMRVDLKFDSLPKKKFQGIVRNISPATGAKFSLLPPDNATGNFTKIVQRVPVIVDFDYFPDDQTILVPGMSVQVSIRTDQPL